MSPHTALFFPALSRRKKYLGSGTVPASYSDYHSEIAEDCEKRCVYCDITLGEHGFEGMHLDHFRPQKHFPALANDPKNLVLSCPKCNRSKWYHWPGDKVHTAPSHNGRLGFIDPFNENRKDYFIVKANGQLEVRRGPAQYMIDLLKLNRKARTQVRRMRIIKNEIYVLVKQCSLRTKHLVDCYKDGTITVGDAMIEIEHLQAVLDNLLILQAKHCT